MNSINFKIKSSWFNEFGKIYNVKDKAFWVYINLKRFEIVEGGIALVNIIILHERLNNDKFKITKNEIKEYLKKLKDNEMIWYDSNKYRMRSNQDLIAIEFVDLPQTERKENIDIPISDDDYYLIVSTESIKYMLSCGLDHKHVLVYLYLSKFNGEIYASCRSISNSTGLGINQINKTYLVDLEEKSRLICNIRPKNKSGREYNYFILCRNVEKIGEFYEKNKEYFRK